MKIEHPACIILSGPSGVGKSTVLKKLMQTQPDLYFSVSATTRAPRPGEREGVDYAYLRREEFEALLENDGLLEYTCYAGEYYGTPRAQMQRAYDQGRDIFFDVDERGARSIREKLPDSVAVLLAPPSMAVLEQRLRGRNTETEEKIQRRLETAKNYFEQIDIFDYVISAETPEYAAARLEAILISQRLRILKAEKIKEFFI